MYVLVLKIALLLVKNVFFGVKNGMTELRFYFCLRFRCHFLGITSFKILSFRKTFFFQFQILRFHRKMYSLFPCIPIFRMFFSLKSVKKMCMCGWVKNCIVTCEKFIFWCEKGYEWILAVGNPKTYYSWVDLILWTSALSHIVWIESCLLSFTSTFLLDGYRMCQ